MVILNNIYSLTILFFNLISIENAIGNTCVFLNIYEVWFHDNANTLNLCLIYFDIIDDINMFRDISVKK